MNIDIYKYVACWLVCPAADLQPPYHEVQQEGDDGTEVHQVHRLLEEAELPRRTHEPDTVFTQEEQDGCIF